MGDGGELVMSKLINTVKEFCLNQGFEKTYWIAYSGGLDSLVLLHLFAELRLIYPLKLRAVYINHGLSQNAANWAVQCAEQCRQLQIDFCDKKIEIETVDKSLEEAARDCRYAVFAECLEVNDVLVTAHHQDDQAETVLLQLVRGAGPKGLAAMPAIKPFAKGFQARPLLDFTRKELKEYAEQNQLRWIEDESNTNTSFDRNFLRHHILPVLKTRWPGVTNTLSRVAENCAEAQQVLDEFVLKDLAFVGESSLSSLQNSQETTPSTLSIKKLLQLDPVRQRHVLRAWFHKLHLPTPPSVKLQQIQTDMLNAQEDKLPHLVWSNVELRRYRDDLYVMLCMAQHDATQSYEWNFLQPLDLPNVGTLCALLTKGQGLRTDVQQVSVRYRQGGETLRLPGRKCHHSLKKLFQDWGIPPWQRDRVPLVYVGEKLAAIVGFFISEELEARGDEEGYKLMLDIPLL